MSMEIRKSNELQIGKAGEYLTCADLCIKGLIAFPSEQGLPYDVLIDIDGRLLKCQVKTTEKPRIIQQRNKETKAYIFNIKRKGKNNLKRYTDNEVDVFAIVALDIMSVGYIINAVMPDTLNVRIDKLKGSYYDEKGIANYNSVINLSKGFTQKQISEHLKLNISTVSRMLNPNYKPYKTNARYFSEFIRDKNWFKEWFYNEKCTL